MFRNSTSRAALRVRSVAMTLVALVAASPTAAFADDLAAPAAPTAPASPPAPAPSPSPGLKVNVDPQTGRFLETPSREPGTGAASQAEALPPLAEEANPIRGGGVRLQVPDARFHSELKANTAPNGSTDVSCGAPAK